jgi:hypothetical protein
MEALTGTSKEVGLGVDTEKTYCILISHRQNSGRNLNINPLEMWQS